MGRRWRPNIPALAQGSNACHSRRVRDRFGVVLVGFVVLACGKSEKDGDLTTDESRREQESLQKVTDRWTAEVDRVGKHKETEIMEVG